MLELRPTCENCNKAASSGLARCAHLYLRMHLLRGLRRECLYNVCPNCGGGFVPRPIRPARNWHGDNFLGKDPASTTIKHRPVDSVRHAVFSAAIRNIPPEKK